MLNSVKIENINTFLFNNRKQLLNKKFIIEMFTSTNYDNLPDELKEDKTEWTRTKDGVSVITIKGSSNPENHKGNIYNFSENADVWNIYGCADIINDNDLIFYNLKNCKPYSSIRGIVDLNDELLLGPGQIENYNENKIIITTYGRYLLNYLLLANPFNNAIPYINDIWNTEAMGGVLANALINNEITVDQFSVYFNNGSNILSDGQFVVPTMTEKSLVSDPELNNKLHALLEKNKDKIHDPTVLKNIENSIVDMDKAWLKDDPSLDFYSGSKDSFENHRKKMFGTGGLVEAFKQGTKEYRFIADPLSEGWKKKDIPARNNEIRKASFGRGKQTAEGGTITKRIMQVFQNLMIVENDCGTKHGLKITLTKQFIKLFIDRYVIENNRLNLITNKNYNDFIGKVVYIRSPMLCESKNGFCYKCCGRAIETFNIKSIGLYATEIGSIFMLIAMKTMHTTTVNLFDASNIENFIFRR